MNTARISVRKFQELCDQANVDIVILKDVNWLREHLKCSVKVDHSVEGGLKGDLIILEFENEQDYIWFKLKYL